MTNNSQRPTSNLNETIKHTISVQSDSIERLTEHETIDEICQSAKIIDENEGRVIFSGIGKSGDVAEKIASTFNSIGISSHFVHPVESLHGDFGAISGDDTVVLISNSGNTHEVVEFLRLLQPMGVTSIAITSDPESKLGQDAEYHINTHVDEEGAVLDLVPMASSTVTMVIGDCLANVLMKRQEFSMEEYGRLHPGGIIGKRLLLNVEDIMYTKIPPANPSDTLAELLVKMSNGGKGVAVIKNDDNEVLGVLTDGDIRRLLESGADLHSVSAHEVMIADPITVTPEKSAISALELLKQHNINHLVVIDEYNNFKGVVDFHDIVDQGLTTTK